MNKKTITTMLIICMLVAVAMPSSAFAATNCSNNNYSKLANMFTNCDINKTFENFFSNGFFKNQNYTFKCTKSGDVQSNTGTEATVNTGNNYGSQGNCTGQDCSNKNVCPNNTCNGNTADCTGTDCNANAGCEGNTCNKQNTTASDTPWWQSIITGADNDKGNAVENNSNDSNQGDINSTDKTDNKDNAVTESNNATGYVGQVLSLVNSERAKEGLASLTLSSKLSQVAQAKAVDMRDNKYFSHTSPTYGSPFDMMKTFGITYTAAGENIAKGQKTPESVMNAWMNSSGHRANIMSTSFEHIGIGYTTDSQGNTYWVQMFIR